MQALRRHAARESERLGKNPRRLERCRSLELSRSSPWNVAAARVPRLMYFGGATGGVKFCYIERVWHLCRASYRKLKLEFCGSVAEILRRGIPALFQRIVVLQGNAAWTIVKGFKLYLRVLKNRCILKRQFAFSEDRRRGAGFSGRTHKR